MPLNKETKADQTNLRPRRFFYSKSPFSLRCQTAHKDVGVCLH